MSDNKEITVIMPEVNLAELTGIPNMTKLNNKELSFNELEKLWTKEVFTSASKLQEWLFRHAIGLALWRKVLAERSKEYEGTPQEYFAKWGQENLGISSDLLNKRRRAGEFVLRVRSGIRGIKRRTSSEIPQSYRTLTELSSLTDEELIKLEQANLLHAEVTYEDIRDFKKKLKADSDRLEKAKEREHAKHTESLEGELLTFKYAENVPEWIIEKIEDLVFEVTKEALEASPTLKFPEGNTLWVCTLVKGMWDATCIDNTPKDEVRPKEPPKAAAATEPPQKPQIFITDEEVETLTLLGINLRKKYMEKWALSAISEIGMGMYKDSPLLEDFFKAVEKWAKR